MNEATYPSTQPDVIRAERLVMLHLTHGEHPWPWSVRELALELNAELETSDAVVALEAAGLLHRIGEFVFPTRAALRMARISEGMV